MIYVWDDSWAKDDEFWHGFGMEND